MLVSKVAFWAYLLACVFHESEQLAKKLPKTRTRPPKVTRRPGGTGSNGGDDDATFGLNHLIDSIFGNYHKELVPKRPTTVKLDLLLLKVKSTIEKEGIFESVIALFMEWQDKRMQWDPREFDNVSVLAFESDRVWLPDIAMTNSADHLYSISKDTRFVVRVTYDGSMKFVPTGTARTWCDLKLLPFPFDVQNCTFEFESWSLDSSTMTFNDSSEAMVDPAFSSPQWELCQRAAAVYQHHYEFTGEIFTRVRFDFVVRRKSTFYIINLIFPCTTLSLIQLLVFAIPSTDSTSDRVGFGTTNLLTLVVFQTIVTAEMPKSSDAVTALSKYIIALIIISAVGILESVVAERLLRTTTSPPPRWASRLVSIFPLIWGSQLPSGISQMILEGTDFANEPKDSPDKSKTKADEETKACCPAPRGEILSRPSSRSSRSDPWVPQSEAGTRRRKSSGGAVGKARRRSRLRKSARAGSYPTSVESAQDLQAHSRLRQHTKKRAHSDFQGIDEQMAWAANRGEPYGFSSPTGDSDYVMSSVTTRRSSQGPTKAVVAAKSDLIGISESSKVMYSSGVTSFDLRYSCDAGSQRTIEASDIVDAKQASNDASNANEEAKKLQEQLTRIKNGILWGELVTKIDHFIFISCTALALGIPIVLFIPLVLFDEHCENPL